MIDVKSVNPMTLPSVSIRQRRMLPETPSIYFVIEGMEIVYIGRSVNPKNRWGSHHKLNEVSDSSRISWLDVSDSSLLSQIETILIDYFNPILNESRPIVPRSQYSDLTGELRNKIGSFIESKGITVYQFIKETGISRTTGYKLANDPRHLPSISVLTMLCDAYKVQPSEFIYWDG